LDELAQMDALQAGFDAKTSTTIGLSTLSLSTLKNLSENRVNNCLRWWLGQNGLQMPSQQQLQQMSQQLLHAKSDANIALKISENLTLRRYQNRAYLVPQMPPIMPPNTPINLLWQGEASVILPDNSCLIFTQKMGEGFALNRFKNIKLRIKNREGGERFKPELGRPSRSLKVILQNADMPPWQREQLPLIFMDETLVVIPNIGVDAGLQAGGDEVGLLVTWLI
jgi:tRNA(Ile)-lysidine synthase